MGGYGYYCTDCRREIKLFIEGKPPLKGKRGRRTRILSNCLKSIVLIASERDLEPMRLVDALIEAWTNKSSHCGTLKIICRELNEKLATFLITNEEEVVSQFPITTEFLKNPKYLKNQIQQNFPTSHRPKKIGDLRYGMKGFDLKAKVIKIPPALNVITRFGTSAYVSNVTIVDDTGSIRLSLWNEQIDKVHVGDEVELKNCYIKSYKGEPQLRLGRKGGSISTVNRSKDKT